MEILWIAIILYSAGLALVLHLRPSLMFNEDGTWKEFGYQRSPRHTLLPFWLFVIAWAFISYTMAASVSWLWFSWFSGSYLAAPAAASYSSFTSFSSSPESRTYTDSEEEGEGEGDEETDDETNEVEMPMTSVSSLPAKRGPGRPRKEKVQSGYYIREESGSGNENGLKRYIYYGPEAPMPKQDMLQQ